MKTKLYEARKNIDYSQDELANLVGMTQSNYCKKENGYSPITKKEWELLAKKLEVQVEDIFEKEETKTYIYKNIKGNSFNSGTININIPDFVMNYLQILEKKNLLLEEELLKLKGGFGENSNS